jgi:hypothetical protein
MSNKRIAALELSRIEVKLDDALEGYWFAFWEVLEAEKPVELGLEKTLDLAEKRIKEISDEKRDFMLSACM